jgi:hypothetical protein
MSSTPGLISGPATITPISAKASTDRPALMMVDSFRPIAVMT